MKALPFLPLAYIADTYGFALFAPYAVLVFVILLWLRSSARREKNHSTNSEQISTN